MIVLPQKFEEILKQDTSGYYAGAVNITRSKFDQVFSENNLYFFEEYTDHGIRHINSVLAACGNLITPDTYKLLSEKDICILILSVFLHDLGMHLQPLTFQKMINGGYDDVLNTDFDDQKWSVLWENYLFEARKFNDQQRKNIFGDVGVYVTEPDLTKPDSLNGIHKKLIGEFIRRYHPRIAFEMVFKGLTAHDGMQIDFCADFDNDHRCLAGLLARSHGMNIRDTFSILNERFSRAWKRPFDIHIIYLMAVLRLADYFQIDSKRILKIPYLTKQFRSPVSFSEHQKHLQTKYVQQLDDDPETLFITAEPTNNIYYLALDKLFNDIQNEVDNSWAVLGEIYGSKGHEEQPKLKYRRLRSNLDDKKIFDSKVKYVPECISFTVDKEIPKLLVGPLYNNEPTFGVRELIQNSVDACWEREFYEQRGNNLYEGVITIEINYINEQYLFSISDNGKGMTLEEIRNYFLKIGGSFRKSNKWQQDHVDVEGHSNINKSGRFGIGVLAAYLLGTEIEVKTKSIFSPIGYSFKTTLEQGQIEIWKEKNIGEGTIISIMISKNVFKKLLLETHDPFFFARRQIGFTKWYVLKSPKIVFKGMGAVNKLGYEDFLPGVNDVLDYKWHEIKDENYKRVIWSYWTPFSSKLICNGIIIPEPLLIEGAIITPPTIMVFDFDAKLPIDLNRTSAILPLSFFPDLEKDVYRDFVAMILLQNVSSPFCENYIAIAIVNKISHPFKERNNSGNNIFELNYCINGFVLNDPTFLNQLNGLYHLAVFISQSDGSVDFSKLEVSNVDIVSFFEINHSDKNDKSFYRKTATDYFKEYEVLDWTNDFKSSLPDTNSHRLKLENISQKEIIKDWKYSKGISLIYYKSTKIGKPTNIFTRIVTEYLGEDLIIPYNIEDRKKKFPKAFKELEPYMQKYLKGK